MPLCCKGVKPRWRIPVHLESVPLRHRRIQAITERKIPIPGEMTLMTMADNIPKGLDGVVSPPPLEGPKSVGDASQLP